MTASRNRIDCENGNESGATNISSGAKIPPARPVKTAESAKAAVLTITGLRPIERAASSASRTATMRHAPAAVGEAVKSVERCARERTASIAISRSAKISAPIDGGWMPIRPFEPPVRVAPFDRAVLDDERKGDRDHGEIGAGDAQSRQRQHEAHDAGDGARERQCDPEVDALEREDGDRVGADRVEADMAERHLPGQSEQNIEPDADDRGQGDQREDERRVAIGLRRQQQRRRRSAPTMASGTTLRRGVDPHRQTLFTAARPKSPLGMKARARMTTLNTTIWV